MQPAPKKLRVLLVADLLPWICGVIARRIAHHNGDWMEPTVCSSPVLLDVVNRCGGFPGEVDLVHFMTEYEAEVHLDSFVDKVPCVITVHHVEGERTLAPVPRCDAVGVLCRQWQDYLLEHGVDPGKIVMTPDGVDAAHFRPPGARERIEARRRFGLDPDAFVVGFIGKRSSDTSGRKGLDVLLRAIDQIGDRVPGASLLLVGPGWSDIVEHARSKGIACAHIPFIAGHDEFANVYHCLDTYWVTSRIEGGPVPVLEAMSSGVPCITTPVGMAADLVRDGENGFVVPFNDADAVLRRTSDLMRDPDLKRGLGEAARRTILDGYQWRTTTRTAWPLYKTAIDRFKARYPQSHTPPLIERPTVAPETGGTFEVPYLASFPRHLHSWIVAKEHFLLTDHLRGLKEHEIARKLDDRQEMFRNLTNLGWRGAAHDSLLKQGWGAFMDGDRSNAKAHAVRAIRRLPWGSGGWRLLLCSFLKPCPPTPVSTGE